MKPNHLFAALTVAFIFISVVGFFMVKAQEDTSIKTPTDVPTPTIASSGLDFRGQVGNNQTNPTGTPQNMDVAELKIQEVKEGTGSAVKAGDVIVVNYEGKLLNGQKFDSSYDRGQPLEIQIGVGRVIPGWDKGMIGMKTGGKRVLSIPSSLAYGAQGAGGVIPPNAGLLFTVELVEIKPVPENTGM